MGRKQPFGSFLKNRYSVISFLGVDAFLPIWILFVLDFYFYIFSSGYFKRKFRGKYQGLYLLNRTDLHSTNMAPQFLWIIELVIIV